MDGSCQERIGRALTAPTWPTSPGSGAHEVVRDRVRGAGVPEEELPGDEKVLGATEKR